MSEQSKAKQSKAKQSKTKQKQNNASTQARKQARSNQWHLNIGHMIYTGQATKALQT
jgi:hypothetical protein